MILNETFLAKPIIEEISREDLPDGVLCRVSYPICDIGQKNANGRVYESAVWEKVLAEKDLKEKLENRALFGHAEHPEQTQSNLEKTSHVIFEMWIDKDKVWQKFDVVDTPTGRIVDCLLKSCQVGCSTRAEGDLEEAEDDEGNAYQRVIPESYKYVTTDFTADPSTFGSIPYDIQRNVVSKVEKELKNEKLNGSERQFAQLIFESMKCQDSKCVVEGAKKIAEKVKEEKQSAKESITDEKKKVDEQEVGPVNKAKFSTEGGVSDRIAVGNLLRDKEGNDWRVEEVLNIGMMIYKIGEPGTEKYVSWEEVGDFGFTKIGESKVKEATSVEKDGKWFVESPSGAILGGPYKSKIEADRRKKDVEFYAASRESKVEETKRGELKVGDRVEDDEGNTGTIQKVPVDPMSSDTVLVEYDDTGAKATVHILRLKKIPESKVDETVGIKAMYKAAKLPAPDGKGIHTKAFHELAIKIAKGYVKGGDTPQKALDKAYPTAMKQLGKEKAVKKPHQKSESKLKEQEHPSDNIKVGDIVKVLRGRYKGKVGKVEDFMSPDEDPEEMPEGQFDVKMSDGSMRYLGWDDVELVESKVNEDRLANTIANVLRDRDYKVDYEELEAYLKDLNTDDYNALQQAVKVGDEDEIANIMRDVEFMESKIEEGFKTDLKNKDKAAIKAKISNIIDKLLAGETLSRAEKHYWKDYGDVVKVVETKVDETLDKESSLHILFKDLTSQAKREVLDYFEEKKLADNFVVATANPPEETDESKVDDYEGFKAAVGVKDEKEAQKLWKDFKSFDAGDAEGESERFEVWMREKLPSKYESKIDEDGDKRTGYTLFVYDVDGKVLQELNFEDEEEAKAEGLEYVQEKDPDIARVYVIEDEFGTVIWKRILKESKIDEALSLQKGKSYTGDELESLGYEINYDHPNADKIGERQFIWTSNDGKSYITNDLGNDNYRVVRGAQRPLRKESISTTAKVNEEVSTEEMLEYVSEYLETASPNEIVKLHAIYTEISPDEIDVWKEKLFGMAEADVDVCKEMYSMIQSGHISGQKESISTTAKEIKDLRVEEASTRAERDKAVELLEEITDENKQLEEKIRKEKAFETKILVNKISKTLEAKEQEVDAVRAKLEEKAKLAADLTGQLEEKSKIVVQVQEKLKEVKTNLSSDIKNLNESVSAAEDKHQKDLSEAEKKYQKELNKVTKSMEEKIEKTNRETKEKVKEEVTKEFVKRFIEFKLSETGLKVDENSRALLENCKSIEEVDDLLEEITDASRRSALHSDLISSIQVKKHVVVDPEEVEAERRVTDVFEGMGM